MPVIGFHISDVPPDVMKKQGMGAVLTSGQTILNVMPKGIVPDKHVFVSKEPSTKYDGRYLYKINITGLSTYPDIPSFADHGAYIEENEMWWKRLPDKEPLRSWVKNTLDDMSVNYDDVSGEDSWNLIGSMVVAGSIPYNKVISVTDRLKNENIIEESKMAPFDRVKRYFPDAEQFDWHQHENGGGWVENTAKVDNSAHVGENAIVAEGASVVANAKIENYARVYGNAIISGNARIAEYAQVFENAKIFGNAEVADEAMVFGEAKIYGKALIHGKSRIYDRAQVYGEAQIYTNGKQRSTYDVMRSGVYDDAKVFGKAIVFDDAHILGYAQVSGNSEISGDTIIRDHAKVFGKTIIEGDSIIRENAQVEDCSISDSTINSVVKNKTFDNNKEVVEENKKKRKVSGWVGYPTYSTEKNKDDGGDDSGGGDGGSVSESKEKNSLNRNIKESNMTTLTKYLLEGNFTEAKDQFKVLLEAKIKEKIKDEKKKISSKFGDVK